MDRISGRQITRERMKKLIPAMDRVLAKILLGCLLLRNSIFQMARGTQVQEYLRLR